MVNVISALLAGALWSFAAAQSTTPIWPSRPSAVPLHWQNPYANTTGPKPPVNPNTPYSNTSDANNNYSPSYSPARGPALPLAVRSPYTSAWTSTASNGSLNSNPVVFWDGSALGWEGIATVDGISYEWMGVGSRDLPKLSNFISALPQTVAYDSQYSNFTFQAGPVEIAASFFSPVIPQDLCRTSIPLSYLTISAKSLDGAEHNVSLYTDVNGAWVTQPSAPLTWEIYENGNAVNNTDSAASGSTTNDPDGTDPAAPVVPLNGTDTTDPYSGMDGGDGTNSTVPTTAVSSTDVPSPTDAFNGTDITRRGYIRHASFFKRFRRRQDIFNGTDTDTPPSNGTDTGINSGDGTDTDTPPSNGTDTGVNSGDGTDTGVGSGDGTDTGTTSSNDTNTGTTPCGCADTGSIYTWLIQLSTQYVFGENNGQDAQRAGQGVFPQWGNFSFSTAQGSAQSLTYQSGPAIDQRFKYVMGAGLDNVVDTNYRAYDQQEPVFGYQHQLGMIGSTGSTPITFTIGSVVEPAVRLLTPNGIESLQPWWSKCYGSLFSMITAHFRDLAAVTGLAATFEQKLKDDINQYYGIGGAGSVTPPPFDNSTSPTDPFYPNSTSPDLPLYPNVTSTDPPLYPNATSTDLPIYPNMTRKRVRRQEQVGLQDGQQAGQEIGQQVIFDSADAYGWLLPANSCNSTGVADPDVAEADAYYSVVALAARQIMGAYVLTVPSATSTNQNEPLMFQKEISSNGNTNTVDVIFPAMPFFLWANPNMIRYVLEPLFMNQEEGFYPNKYSMHDLGSRFPNATGHVEGSDEYMPVEESGNMILMVYAIQKFTNNEAYLQAHYKILQQWAQYLIDFSLIPAIQLSTDDFSGELANQTNLAIKGIVGLAAMAEISKAVGDTASADQYSSTAKSFYDQWTGFAIDPSGKHTVLAYQWRSSWGLLYNIYPAKLLGLDIIPQSLYDLQSAWYPTVSQLWGVPLDNRHYWTKSDWSMWTAAYCQPSTRALFVNSLAYWLNTTSSDLPFTDVFQTVHTGETPPNPEFLARPVQGGLFSLLALLAGGTN